jgi:dTDP-glucose pyrophosphorylase
MRSKLTGVILAAGKGTRMDPFSFHHPKPVLPICNIPLIRYSVQYMKELGIREIIVVIGHLGYEITRSLGDGSDIDIQIKYVEQKETLGLAHAIGQLENHISSPFLIILGDVFFLSENLPSILECFSKDDVSGVLAVKEEANSQAIRRNFTVILDEDQQVKRVIEKPRYTPNNMKGCGLYLFDLPFFDAVRRTPRTAMRDEYEITDAIQILIDDGFTVKAACVVKWDMNLTYPHDLLKCNLKQLECLGKNEVVGNNVQIHKNAKLINSVVGDNVVIKNPITIVDSLIFSGSVIPSNTSVEKYIITPERTIDCKYFFKDSDAEISMESVIL